MLPCKALLNNEEDTLRIIYTLRADKPHDVACVIAIIKRLVGRANPV